MGLIALKQSILASEKWEKKSGNGPQPSYVN